MPRRQAHATKKSRSGGLRHWKVKFTRRGMEPPRPFGKTTAVVCAESREAAREMVPASPNYPITVSATTDPVSFTYHCHHKDADEAHEPTAVVSGTTSAHATKKKSPAQLDREIAEVVGDTYPLLTGPGLWHQRVAETREQRRREKQPRAHARRSPTSAAEQRAEDLDVEVAPSLGRSRAEIVRRINAIVRAADGRNVYLNRERLGDTKVHRVTQARTKGRGMEVRVLLTGQWLPVAPEMGDRIDVR